MNCSEKLQLGGTKFDCCNESGHTGDHVDGDMRWFNAGHEGETPEQKHQRSLAYAIEHAKKIAADANESCYILHSEIYANSYHEYDNVEHVVGTRGVFATMYDNWQRPEYNSKLVGVVSPNGEVFLNQLDDILHIFRTQTVPETAANLRRICCPDHRNGGASRAGATRTKAL